MGGKEPLPDAPFFTAADEAAGLEVLALEGHDHADEEYSRTKARLWERMGHALEEAHYPQGKIASKLARSIEERVRKRTGATVSVRTGHFQRVMALHSWQNPVAAAGQRTFFERQKSKKAPEGGASDRQPYMDRAIPALPEDALAPAPAEDAEGKPQAKKRLNTGLAAALRDLSDGLRWASRTLENPEWKGAVDLEELHPREYKDAVRQAQQLTALLLEEGARRSRVPPSGYHLFRTIAGRGELSAMKVCELFARERHRLIAEGAAWLGKAVVRQFRAGTASGPPPILRPHSRETALLLGWSGQRCAGCESWRVGAAPDKDDARDCADCGKSAAAAQHPAVCPDCSALVYGRGDPESIVECHECGHRLEMPARVRREILAQHDGSERIA